MVSYHLGHGSISSAVVHRGDTMGFSSGKEENWACRQLYYFYVFQNSKLFLREAFLNICVSVYLATNISLDSHKYQS